MSIAPTAPSVKEIGVEVHDPPPPYPFDEIKGAAKTERSGQVKGGKKGKKKNVSSASVSSSSAGSARANGDEEACPNPNSSSARQRRNSGHVEDPEVIDIPRTNEEVYEAIEDAYKRKCCFDPKSLDNFQIVEVTPQHAYYYTLETHREWRSLEERQKPYDNHGIDGTGQLNKAVPRMWDVKLPRPTPFSNEKHYYKLPRSDIVIPCKTCKAMGTVNCGRCNGMGYKRCQACEGTGQRIVEGETVHCTACTRTGRFPCRGCNQGSIQCGNCEGQRYMHTWKVICVKFDTTEETHVTPRGFLTSRKLERAAAMGGLRNTHEMAVRQTDPANTIPIACNDPEILKEAKRMLKKEFDGMQNANGKILHCRQSLKMIPVVRVEYNYQTRNKRPKSGFFYVYGRYHEVHFPSGFPETMCCSIA